MTARRPALPGAIALERAIGASAAQRLAPLATVVLLIAGVIGAVALRVFMVRLPQAAAPQGLAFGGALLLMALAAGSRLPALSWRTAAIGVTGGAILVVVPLGLALFQPGTFSGPVLLANAGLPASWWIVVTLVVACGEEAVLRGALFRACLRPLGTVGTVLLTSAVFALIHLPFYGWSSIPVDFAVGIWLGGLRLASGSAAAPAIAHSLADLAAWWL